VRHLRLFLSGGASGTVSLHETFEDLEKDGLFLRGRVKLSATGEVRLVGCLALHVCLRPEDVQGIVHFVEFKELANKFATEHALGTGGCLAGVRVLPVELATALVLCSILLVDTLEHA